jgi:hypothetical protein
LKPSCPAVIVHLLPSASVIVAVEPARTTVLFGDSPDVGVGVGVAVGVGVGVGAIVAGGAIAATKDVPFQVYQDLEFPS